MNSSQPFDAASARRSPVTPLTVTLCVVMFFFCAVLIFVYAATKRANPIMLDQQGRPLQPSAQQAK
jgi:hypothetical protein